MSNMSDKVKEGIHEAAEKVKDVAARRQRRRSGRPRHNAAVKTKDAAHDVGQKVGDAAHNAAVKAKDVVHNVDKDIKDAGR